jgi:AhpD family alkylhydroperoxidase
VRIDYREALPEARRALAEVDRTVRGSSLERKLLELVKVRASQINGCAYCLDMHTKDARAIGETEQRLNLVVAWARGPGVLRARAGGLGLVRGPYVAA